MGDKSTSKADEFEERYINALTLLKENLSHSSSHNQSEQKIKLPVIQIPLFNEKRALALENAESTSRGNNTPPIQRAEPVYGQQRRSVANASVNQASKNPASSSACAYFITTPA